MDSEEAKNGSEIIRTLTLVLSQLEFKKGFDEKINSKLKEIIAATIVQLKYISNDEAKIISSLIEEGKFDEARERLLKISYELLKIGDRKFK
ncbi:MAG: rRNA adenine methyltransferase [Sulfolobaceae archaeon]